MRARPAIVALVLGSLLAGGLIVGLGGSDPPRGGQAAPPGSPAKFAYLAVQKSNRCDLPANSIGSMSDGERLQGACCDPMDRAHYSDQVNALRRYPSSPLIPADPYDIPVSLAKRMLGLNAGIKLDPSERGAYRQAQAMSVEHGLCCCHCWRWQAMGGVIKDLLHNRHWPTSRLASLIGDLNGCGGSST